jgi:hypothetical protein
MITFLLARFLRMMRTSLLICIVFAASALFVFYSAPLSAADVSSSGNAPSNVAPTLTPELIADYEQKLAAYFAARQQFSVELKAYWDRIAELRRGRNVKRRNSQPIALSDYVLTQPPVYDGPPKPKDPVELKATEEETAPHYIPVKGDFLKCALEKFAFMPRQPSTEMDFKKAYARVASAAGITRDQAVRIYSFEAGGNGNYDVQAGLEYNTPGARAMSTALGYNQLLSANSVELLAEEGPQIIRALTASAAQLADPGQAELVAKIKMLQAMVDFPRSAPDDWTEHVTLGNKPEGLGIHALNFDIDVGPYLQVQKLLNSIHFAKAKGHNATLTAAELEMMNLTGDGNGLDMITVPVSGDGKCRHQIFSSKEVMTSVVRKNNVVSELLAATNSKMDFESQLPGAKALAPAF